MPSKAEAEAAGHIRRWREHPASFVREVFEVEPDPWQEETLERFPEQQRIAMQASKGPGKSTVLAWLGWNFLLTRQFPKCIATSVTGDNLDTNLWPEMAKWQMKSRLLSSVFTWTKSRIYHNQYPETWFMAARSWPKSATPEQQADALAGVHADYVLFLIDESGSIPPAIVVTAEAALSSCKEGHIVQAGNTTMRAGMLYACAVDQRHRWYVVAINGDPDNPKRSPRISIEWARDMIADYGRDSPYVKINVFGEFPDSDPNALLSIIDMQEAASRVYREDDIRGAARVMGVDVARGGGDLSVLYPRQGLQLFLPRVWRNLNSIQGAGSVAQHWNEWDAHACFIDDTGGFGAGWIDQLGRLGKAPIGVGFARRAHEPTRFLNKRAEMAHDAAQWVKRGGAIPPGQTELVRALTETTYSHKGEQMVLEPKEDVKARLGYSPDHFDGFILTFAEPVTAPNQAMRIAGPRVEHDPYAAFDREMQRISGRADYDPYGAR